MKTERIARTGRAAWICAVLGLLGAAGAAQAGSAELLRSLSDGLADTVEKVQPSVVVIQTESTRVPYFVDHLYRAIPGRPEKLAGQGSGVIIDNDGHVLTSQHVIPRNPDIIKIVLADGTAYDGEVVGLDRHTDIAVLRMKDPDPDRIVPIEQGDSDSLRAGQMVIAIGSPFSLSGSVSWGIVSSIGRAIGLLPYEDFIQTDAAINPGNSGGPLVDLDGRMIGLNAVIQTGGQFNRGSIGIGFSVPSNRAFSIAEILISGKPVQRPWLGIKPQEMTRAAANYFLGQDGGVYVEEVFRDTPAYRGGLFRGDVILQIDETPITSVLDLQREVFNREIGSPIRMTILRSNQEREVEILTELMPDATFFQ